MSALILLTGLAFWRGAASSAERAFVAVAAAGLVIVVVQAAAHSPRGSRCESRSGTCSTSPPCFCSRCSSGSSAAFRGRRVLTAVAAATPVLLLLALPLRTLITTSMYSDTFGLIPLFRVENFFNGNVDRVRWLMIAGGVGAALLFAFLPRRFALVLPAAVALYLVLGFLDDLRRAEGSLDRDGQRDPRRHRRKLDRQRDRDSATSRRCVRARHGLFASHAPLADRVLEPERRPRLQPRSARAGRRAARSDGNVRPHAGAVYPGRHRRRPLRRRRERRQARREGGCPAWAACALPAARTPIRLVNSISGIYGDGWMGADASYTRYAADRPSAIRVSLSRSAWSGPDVPAT